MKTTILIVLIVKFLLITSIGIYTIIKDYLWKS